MVIDILSLNSQEQRTEPLKGAEISANPEEVNLPQTSARSLRVVHAVPDTLEDGGERSNTNTCTAKHGNFELEHIFGGGTKRSVNVDTGKNLAQSNLFAGLALFALLAGSLLVEVAAKRLSKGLGKVTDHTNMNRDVVFLGRASKGKGMVLPDGDFGAAQEDVLGLLAETAILTRLDIPVQHASLCAPS